MLKEYDEIAYDTQVSFASRSGTPVMPLTEFEWNREGVAQHSAYPLRIKSVCGRSDYSEMLFNQCKRLDIPMTFGVMVDSYEKDIVKGTATAVASDGRRFTADILIAADGGVYKNIFHCYFQHVFFEPLR